MVFKNFRLQIIIRVSLIALTLFLLFYVQFKTEYHVTPVLFLAAALYQVYSLIRYVDKLNRDLKSFLDSIRFSDFSRTFKVEGKGSSFDALKETLNDVILDFQKIRSEKEEHFHYLQNIIQHIGVSIIAYQKSGKVELINNAAKRLFNKSLIKNIDVIESWSKDLSYVLRTINPGENHLVKVKEPEEMLQLAVYATEFKLTDKTVMIVSLKDIRNELEEKEMEAWQKLIRVLTHEIMNSIAPIASLSGTINNMLDVLREDISNRNPEAIDAETIGDIGDAVATIHKRSTGLIHFVETYRNLTKIPKPNFTVFPVKSLFDNILLLIREDMKDKDINLSIDIRPESLELTADEKLIEQVLINLVKNSVQAIADKKDGRIHLKAYQNSKDRTVLQVIDNGQGIIPEVGDKIFIPFFTTKSKGSGIGLSLSRQILRLHKGNITMHSEPDKETSFTLTF